MEPLAISSAATTLSQTLVRASASLHIFLQSTPTSQDGIDSSIRTLRVEIDGLNHVVKTIAQAIKDPLLQSRTAAVTGAPVSLWICVTKELNNSTDTGAEIFEAVRGTIKDKSSKKAFWSKTLKQVKNDLSAENVRAFRNQVLSHTTFLQLSLQMINLHIACQTPDQIDSLCLRINDLISSVPRNQNGVETTMENDHVWEFKNTAQHLLTRANAIVERTNTNQNEAFNARIIPSDEAYNAIHAWLSQVSVSSPTEAQPKPQFSARQRHIVHQKSSSHDSATDVKLHMTREKDKRVHVTTRQIRPSGAKKSVDSHGLRIPMSRTSLPKRPRIARADTVRSRRHTLPSRTSSVVVADDTENTSPMNQNAEPVVRSEENLVSRGPLTTKLQINVPISPGQQYHEILEGKENMPTNRGTADDEKEVVVETSSVDDDSMQCRIVDVTSDWMPSAIPLASPVEVTKNDVQNAITPVALNAPPPSPQLPIPVATGKIRPRLPRSKTFEQPVTKISNLRRGSEAIPTTHSRKPVHQHHVSEGNVRPTNKAVPINEHQIQQKLRKPINQKPSQIRDQELITSLYKAMKEDPSRASTKVQEAIFAIVKGGTLFAVQTLFDEKLDASLPRDAYGHDPLMSAVIHQRLSVVMLLLVYGVSVTHACQSKLTALHYACQLDPSNIDFAKQLITAGSNVNARNAAGQTPLSLAIDDEDVPLIELLIQSGARLNSKDVQGNTALHKAAGINRPKALKTLLEKDPHSLCVLNLTYKTPLDLAVNGGYFECVQLILDCFQSMTPRPPVKKILTKAVDESINNSDSRLLSTLLNHPISSELDNDAYRTRIFMTALSSKKDEIADMMLGLGLCMTYEMGEHADQPLHLATRLSRFEYVKKLLEAGARDAHNGKGETALDLAGSASPGISRLLMDYHMTYNE